MNRIYKFRAWADGKMHYDNFSIEFNGGEMDSMIAYTQSDGKVITCEDFILMQFTSLHDKNGTEGIQSDLIIFSDRSRNCGNPVEIIWKDGSWCGQYVGTDFVFVLNQREMSRSEVIGNRWENPEFLEKQ